jgi:hypothetical protein
MDVHMLMRTVTGRCVCPCIIVAVFDDLNNAATAFAVTSYFAEIGRERPCSLFERMFSASA